METLLPRRSPRSDDLERGEPGPPLHPITGTFADATHAKDFAARCFRWAFPLHAMLLAASAMADTYYLLSMSTAPSISNIAIVRRGMRRAKHELRHGIIGYAIDGREYNIDGINGLPYITHTQHDLDGLPGYSSDGRRDDARRQAALRNCPYN